MDIVKLADILIDTPKYGAPLSALKIGKYKYLRQTDIESKQPTMFVDIHNNCFLEKGDLLISRAGMNAGTPYIHSTNEKWVYAGYLVKYNINEELADTKFIYYFLLKNIKNIKKIANAGSTMPKLNPPAAKKIEIKLPTLVEQQYIIDIIEPFEEEKSIRENMNRTLLKLIKNHNSNNILDEKITLNDLVLRTKKKNIEIYQNVIDLSSINNDSLTLFSFKKTSDFNSNIFETKEGDLFLSSIRPSLKKYGISPFDMNILGTLFNFRPLIYENRGLVLSCISSNNFQNFLIQSSEGTKMPIVKWDKFKDFKFNKINDDESLLFNSIFDFIKLNNKILNVLYKILNNLIELNIK